MSRVLTSAFAEALQADVINLAYFASFAFSGGTVRFWSGTGQISWSGSTWTGAGNLADFSPVEESRIPEAPGMRFTLNGIDSSILGLALTEQYRNRPCSLFMAVMNENFNTVVASYRMFGGRMSTMLLEDGGNTGGIVIEAENELADLMRVNAFRYTDAHQTRVFPGDTGLRYVNAVANRKILWGRVQQLGYGGTTPGIGGPGTLPGGGPIEPPGTPDPGPGTGIIQPPGNPIILPPGEQPIPD